MLDNHPNIVLHFISIKSKHQKDDRIEKLEKKIEKLETKYENDMRDKEQKMDELRSQNQALNKSSKGSLKAVS